MFLRASPRIYSTRCQKPILRKLLLSHKTLRKNTSKISHFNHSAFSDDVFLTSMAFRYVKVEGGGFGLYIIPFVELETIDNQCHSISSHHEVNCLSL